MPKCFPCNRVPTCPGKVNRYERGSIQQDCILRNWDCTSSCILMTVLLWMNKTPISIIILQEWGNPIMFSFSMHSPAPNAHAFYSFFKGFSSFMYILQTLEFEDIFIIQNASIFAQVELASSLSIAPQTRETESPGPQMQNCKIAWQRSFEVPFFVLICSFLMSLLDGAGKYWTGYDLC